MTESDRKYYQRKEWQDKKKKKALEKARRRGEAATKWVETNKLTAETKPEFDKLMKTTDK
jgi:hypothetical protein